MLSLCAGDSESPVCLCVRCCLVLKAPVSPGTGHTPLSPSLSSTSISTARSSYKPIFFQENSFYFPSFPPGDGKGMHQRFTWPGKYKYTAQSESQGGQVYILHFRLMIRTLFLSSHATISFNSLDKKYFFMSTWFFTVDCPEEALRSLQTLQCRVCQGELHHTLYMSAGRLDVNLGVGTCLTFSP